MKKLMFLTITMIAIGSSTASAKVSDYTEKKIKEMPRFSSIEQQRCPSARYTSVKERLECKIEVRVEIYEKQKTRKEQHDAKNK